MTVDWSLREPAYWPPGAVAGCRAKKAVAIAVKGKREPVPAREMARRWRKRIVKSRLDAEQVEHYIEVRYEDMITDTEGVLRREVRAGEVVRIYLPIGAVRILSKATTAITITAFLLLALWVVERNAGKRISRAIYSGDGNHEAITGTCGSENFTLSIDNGSAWVNARARYSTQ